MLIEMRRYAIMPGKMYKMHTRMSDLLFPLFREHGVPEPIGIWETHAPEPTLTWLVEWPDFETRQAVWELVGPAFAAARAQETTPEFVTRTNLTLISPWPGARFGFDQAPAFCESAWHVQPKIGFGAGFAAVCKADLFARFRAAGAIEAHGCNLLFGALPQAMIMLGWPNAASRESGLAALVKEKLPASLADKLLGHGACYGDCGVWEILDRATYLNNAAVL